jgi:hypothetical protein
MPDLTSIVAFPGGHEHPACGLTPTMYSTL